MILGLPGILPGLVQNSNEITTLLTQIYLSVMYHVWDAKVGVLLMPNTTRSLPQLIANFQISKRERNIRDICIAMKDACKRGTEGFQAKPEI